MIRHLYNKASHICESARLLVSVSAEHCMFLKSIPELTAFRMLAPRLPTCFSITGRTCMVWKVMLLKKIKIVNMGAKLDIRTE